MSGKERMRLSVFGRVARGEISVVKAAELSGLSLRQGRRVWKRYKAQGDAGLVHGLRGRASNAGQAEVRQKVLERCRARYSDFGSSLAAEYLAGDGLEVSRKTLWRWRRQSGDLGPRRKGVKHRTRRARRSCIGELVQMDGSTHDWFEGRRGPCVLFVMIDDASGRVFCRFYESEDTRSAFALVGGYVRKNGLPMAFYVDKDSIYRVNDPLAQEHGRQRGQEPLTQFGRAMKELDVRMIFAHSPQAKGRVERVNGTLQDRLVKALRVEGISTIEEANEFLRRKFLPKHNRKFGQATPGAADVHRTLPPGRALAEVLCVQETRTVGRDWCVTYGGRVLQLDKRHEKLALAGRGITVSELASGPLRLTYQGHRLRWKEAACRVESSKATESPSPSSKRPLAAPPKPSQPWRPPADHPWRTTAVKAASLRSAPLRSASRRDAALTIPTG
jgi:transposase